MRSPYYPRVCTKPGTYLLSRLHSSDFLASGKDSTFNRVIDLNLFKPVVKGIMSLSAVCSYCETKPVGKDMCLEAPPLYIVSVIPL